MRLVHAGLYGLVNIVYIGNTAFLTFYLKSENIDVLNFDIDLQGPPKKCIHNLTKENSTLYNRLL
jgi:hypothetical protein